MNKDLFLDSIRALEQNWELLLAIIVYVAWGALLVFAILKKITGRYYSDIELTALALGGWPIPVLLLSVLMIFLNMFVSTMFIITLSLTLTLCSAGLAVHSVRHRVSPGIIPLGFAILVFVRLGFAANIVLPAYFDSAEHYRIIQSLLSKTAVFPAPTYYHIGYHFIIAALTLVTHQNIGQVMLVFGQVILAAIPMPLYFFIRHMTGSHKAALFGVMLAAFGWFMPAHAVNWGKYPALLSLLMIQFTLGMALMKNRALVALSLIVSALIHSRSPILLTIIFGAWLFSRIWMGQNLNKRALLFGLIGILLGSVIVWIKQDQVLGPIFVPYQIWVTLLIGLLSALVFRTFPQLIFFCVLAIPLTLAGMFVPVTPTITLLDRPLMEMTLFLPLAFLGGLGITRIPRFAVTLITLSIIIHAWVMYDFSPSQCCQLAGRDDAVALDWMDRNLPADAYIAIASAELDLNSFGRSMQSTGSDAGIWVAPLTQRATLPLPYLTDFLDQNTHAQLCAMPITHIYVGARPQSFNPDFIIVKPAWYKTVLFLPNAQIVHVQGC